jgi:outer membrane protein TolC
MTSHRQRVALAAAVLSLLAPSLASAQTLSLDEAMRSAANHPSVASAQADRAVASAASRQVSASYGPTLSAAANLRVWDSPLEVSLGGGGGAVQLPPPQTAYEQILFGMVNAPPTTIRDQVTWDASLTIAQPLSALWTINLGARLAALNEHVADQQLDLTQRQLARDAAQSYFRVLQARAQLANSNESVLQLDAQVKRLAVLVENGAANQTDLLRIDVALANAHQQVLRAESDLTLARAALAVAAGLEPSAPVDVQDLPVGRAPAPPCDLDACVARALEKRQEIAQLQTRLEQSDLAIKREEAAYIPQVNALANYTHTAGQGLAGADNFFLGLSLNWTIYEWGKTRTLIDQAEANVTKVQASRTLVKRQLELQVRKAWLDLDATSRQLSVAQRAVAQAQESFRVEEERFNAGRSTSTDLLAAQAALAQAKNNESTAYYQALVHHAELQWATGVPLTAQSLIAGANP